MKFLKFTGGLSLVGISLVGTYMYVKMRQHVQAERDGSAFQDYERQYINSMIRLKVKKDKS